MARRKPQLAREGTPGCVHHEIIDDNLWSYCLKCPLVKYYGNVENDDLAPASRTVFGSMTLSQVKQQQRKGGKTPRKPVGSKNHESNTWNSMQGQKSKRMLIKGVDF